MKKVFTVLAAVILTVTVWAQSPQKMSYQAVIRNSSDVLVTNTQIGMEINIRQGSPAGTVIYTETQTPTTNANGLVSIDIGGGIGFDAIDWANGPYFIETNTAVVPPLTTYTVTGISQLLSVPYALHAKTADYITGVITETDPVYSSSVASEITSSNIINWNNKLDSEADSSVTNEIQILSISNDTIYLSNGGFVKLPAGFDGQYSSLTGTPAYISSFINDAGYLTSFTEVDGSVTNEIQTLSINNDTIYLSNGGFVKLPVSDGSETKINAGTNVIVTGSGTTVSPYLISAGGSHYIGELYSGGVVFWVDNTGQHGLILSMLNLSTSQAWSNITNIAINTTNDWDGVNNTTAITQQSGHTSSAANLCANYSNADYGTGTYSDWYLPSVAELNHVWNNFYEVQKSLTNDGNALTTILERTAYWSSSESGVLNAWYFNFVYGYANSGSKGTASYYVRAVRAF